MMDDVSKFTVHFSKDDVVCRQGDITSDLFVILSGKLMVCSRQQHRVTPLAYLGAGDYFGELSFFDQRFRSADCIALEKTSLVKIPQGELHKQFPFWMRQTAKHLARKLRYYNDLVNSRGLRRSNTESLQALTMDQQRFYFGLLSQKK